MSFPPAGPPPVLYMNPLSTTCRPLMFFAADAGIALEPRIVDLSAGEQEANAFTQLNPNQAVPVLIDGSFRLTESAAILRYLASTRRSPAYPVEPQRRARVDEALDWFNTGLMRELAHGWCYPHPMPNHRRGDAHVQQALLAWSRPRAERLLAILDEHMLGPERHYLGGGQPNLADYFGFGVVTLGEATRLELARWPNVRRWIARMRARPGHAASHAVFDEFVSHVKAATGAPAAAEV